MAEDNASPPGDEARTPQARRLAEQALAAERAGDTATADRLFAAAERIDPTAVADVLEEDDSTAARRPARPTQDPDQAPNPGDAGFIAHGAAPAAGLHAWQATGTAGAPRTPPAHPTSFEITLLVNEDSHRLTVDTRTTLLDALRDRLNLTGTKKGCALGQCGSCTVLLDGRRINACLMLAVMAEGRAITTIEGLTRDGALHPLQAAFVAHDAFQCGYCTPGQIMSGVGLLAEGRDLDDEAIREQMSGNICRCGAYVNIVAAIRDARGEQEG